jgi:hypothetical protein
MRPAQLSAVVARLCPDVTFEYDSQTAVRRARERLNLICETQVDAMVSLEVHHRVVVTGKAGTGKTYLATRWAQSGLIGGDDTAKRVLLTCYNDPLGLRLSEQLGPNLEVDESSDDLEEERSMLRVGSFLRVMLELEGMPMPDFENTEDDDFWNVRVPAHLIRYWSEVVTRFDRIIVDEAQDFSPAWLGLLESLLDPMGDNKMFLLVDDRQQLTPRGFVEPSIEAGWVRGELLRNVRNAREIATLARRFLDGAAAQSALPRSGEVVARTTSSDEELVEAVKAEIGKVLERGADREELLVVASNAAVRDLLRRELNLGRFEKAGEGRIVCETAHRAKGLEALNVIVAIGDRGMGDAALYVAITRAVDQLVVAGPMMALARLGLA